MTSCPACTWRYSLHVYRRIIACDPQRLHALTVQRSIAGTSDIGRLRKADHNAVAYQRRRYRQWRHFGVWGWYIGSDFHGVVALGAISTTEFMRTFQRRGEIELRPIDIDDLRIEVYAAARLVSPTSIAGHPGRYQPVKIAIEPVVARKRASDITDYMMVEPMAYLV